VSVTFLVTCTTADRRSESESLTFDQPRVVVGRGAHADVRLPSRAVSDRHLVVHVNASELAAIDEGSTNGASVNGQPLVQGRKKSLRSGDRIAVPGFELVLQWSHAPADPPGRTGTVARRLLGPALVDAAPPVLALVTGRRAGQRWVLGQVATRLVAGRADGCDIVLDDVDCSREHAEFVRDELGVIVRDLGSKNGVFVGERLVTERRLRHGDEVQIGRSVLGLDDAAEALLRSFETGPDEPPDAADMIRALAATATPIPVPVTIEPDANVPRTAPTMPPPAPEAIDALTVSPPAEKPASLRRSPGRTGDWLLVTLAVIVLTVSAAALVLLVRGSPLGR